MDDGYLVGPPSVLFTALERFAQQIWEHCNICLNKRKCEIFSWSGTAPASAPSEMALAGARVAGRLEPELLVYGVPVGTDDYVSYMLDIKVAELAEGAQRTCQVLEGESQALWTCLRLSLQQQFGYWISLVHPTQVVAAAGRVDEVMTQVLEQVGGFRFLEEGQEQEITYPMGPEVQQLQGASFQKILLGLPVKSGGLGLRSQVQQSPAAWIGALEQVVPFFSEFCPLVGHISGMGERSLQRWRPLLQSGLRTGQELRAAWDNLVDEVTEMSRYLGEEELGGALDVPVEAAGLYQGEPSCSGATRMRVVAQLESLRLKSMEKHLKEQRNRQARPVWSWPNQDKFTTAWLLSFPGPHSGLSTPIFQEGLALVLCLPSPACKDRVGEKVGDSRLDAFGDALARQKLCGDGWRIRHDRSKCELMRMMGWSRVVATCEVHGLFQHLTAQEEQNNEEVKTARQVLLPDFRIELPATPSLATHGRALAPGQTETRIAELKICCGKDFYKPGVRQRQFIRAVDARAAELMGDYLVEPEIMANNDQEKYNKVDPDKDVLNETESKHE